MDSSWKITPQVGLYICPIPPSPPSKLRRLRRKKSCLPQDFPECQPGPSAVPVLGTATSPGAVTGSREEQSQPSEGQSYLGTGFGITRSVTNEGMCSSVHHHNWNATLSSLASTLLSPHYLPNNHPPDSGANNSRPLSCRVETQWLFYLLSPFTQHS